MSRDETERSKFLRFAAFLDECFPATHEHEKPGGENIRVLLADRDRLASELQATRAEMERVRHLLSIALPHVEASAGAEHLFDGFRPRVRPLDATVDEIRAALAIMDRNP